MAGRMVGGIARDYYTLSLCNSINTIVLAFADQGEYVATFLSKMPFILLCGVVHDLGKSFQKNGSRDRNQGAKGKSG